MFGGMWYNIRMEMIHSLIRRFLNAIGVRNDDAGRVDDECRRVHSFASCRERALSDLGRIALLEKSLASERSRVVDSGASDPVLIESRALVAAAKENNLFYDITKIPGVRVSLRSGESSVFWNASDSSYYKIKNPFAKLHLKKHHPSDVVFEHVVHNILFPEVELEFLGIGEELGEVRFVFKQRGVRSDRRPTDAQINQHMVGIGLYPEARYCFGNEQLFVTDVLASSDNVLLGDDGRCYVIDPIIGFKKSAKIIIGDLIGERRDSLFYK